MPYALDKSGKCVVRADTGKVMKCYDNHHDAVSYLEALEINVEKARYNIRRKSLVTKFNENHKPTGPEGGQFTTGASSEDASKDTPKEKFTGTTFKMIAWFEHEHAGDAVESMIAVSPDGTPLVHKTGDDHGIMISDDEVKQLSGATFTHNHPIYRHGSQITLSGFSDKDLSSAVHAHLHEVRAVDKAYIHSFLPQPNIDPAKFDALYTDIHDAAVDYWNRRIAQGVPEIAAKQHQIIDTLDKVALATGSTYSIYDRETGERVLDYRNNGLPKYMKYMNYDQ